MVSQIAPIAAVFSDVIARNEAIRGNSSE